MFGHWNLVMGYYLSFGAWYLLFPKYLTPNLKSIKRYLWLMVEKGEQNIEINRYVRYGKNTYFFWELLIIVILIWSFFFIFYHQDFISISTIIFISIYIFLSLFLICFYFYYSGIKKLIFGENDIKYFSKNDEMKKICWSHVEKINLNFYKDYLFIELYSNNKKIIHNNFYYNESQLKKIIKLINAIKNDSSHKGININIKIFK